MSIHIWIFGLQEPVEELQLDGFCFYVYKFEEILGEIKMAGCNEERNSWRDGGL